MTHFDFLLYKFLQIGPLTKKDQITILVQTDRILCYLRLRIGSVKKKKFEGLMKKSNAGYKIYLQRARGATVSRRVVFFFVPFRF
jgi:hypothetical protein